MARVSHAWSSSRVCRNVTRVPQNMAMKMRSRNGAEGFGID